LGFLFEDFDVGEIQFQPLGGPVGVVLINSEQFSGLFGFFSSFFLFVVVDEFFEVDFLEVFEGEQDIEDVLFLVLGDILDEEIEMVSFLLEDVGEESELDAEVVFGSAGGLVLADFLSTDGVILVGHQEEKSHGGIVSHDVLIHQVGEILGEVLVESVVQNSHEFHQDENVVVVEVVEGTLVDEEFGVGSLLDLDETLLGGLEELLNGLFVGGDGGSPNGGHSVESEEILDEEGNGLWLHFLVLFLFQRRLDFDVVEDVEHVHESDGEEEIGEFGDEIKLVVESLVVVDAGGFELFLIGERVLESLVFGRGVFLEVFLQESLNQTQVGDQGDGFLGGFLSEFGIENGFGVGLVVLNVGENFQETVSDLETGLDLDHEFLVNHFSDVELFLDEEVGELVHVDALEIGVVFEQLLNFEFVEVFVVFGRRVSDEGLEGGNVGHEGGSGFDFVDFVDDGRNHVDQVSVSEFGFVVTQLDFSDQRNDVDDVGLDFVEFGNVQFFFGHQNLSIITVIIRVFGHSVFQFGDFLVEILSLFGEFLDLNLDLADFFD